MPSASHDPSRKGLKKLLARLRPDLALMHWLKPFLPRGLYGRALLILVTPVILAQAVATHIFYHRHWQTVTDRLTFALAGEIASLADAVDGDNPEKAIKDLSEPADKHFNLQLQFHKNQSIAEFPMRGNYSDTLGRKMLRALEGKLGRPFALDLRYDHEWIAIHVAVRKGVFTVIAPERRVYTPTASIFIIWMVGSSALLSLIAILFLRNQIRPIRRLALAAEMIGKGQDTPDFRPEGAKEVRQAAINLLIMRDRLKRQIAQRTAMLNGVSHDLRTPLTRMKLQLEMMPSSKDTQELKADVEEMTQMVEAYLAFARGDDADETTAIDVEALLQELVSAARRSNLPIHLTLLHAPPLSGRATALRRALNNLLSNAGRYGKEVWVSTREGKKYFDIIIDDDGPGIPAEQREDVFKPFTRLEESRNSETGGIGLGLTIARDIALQHGGTVLLEDSPHGGLRAIFRMPL